MGINGSPSWIGGYSKAQVRRCVCCHMVLPGLTLTAFQRSFSSNPLSSSL